MAISTSFERTMTKSSPKCLTLPAAFVRAFGDQFHAKVQVKMAGATHVWNVRVNVYFMKNEPHVSFGGGWKAFMRYHSIFQGHKLKITLIGTSLFKVTRVSGQGGAGSAGPGRSASRSIRRSLRLRGVTTPVFAATA